MTEQKHSTPSQFLNDTFPVVAITASAGGLKAIRQILSVLPSGFPASIVVVQHLYPNRHSYLAEILDRCTALRVKSAEAGELVRPGMVYVAIPSKHLLVDLDGRLSFSDTAKVNFSRPSADVLFESVATSLKTRTIAVVLTGRDGDGARGVQIIKQHGGIVIAQDEVTSEVFSMPKSAIATGCVDFVLPLKAIAATLMSLIMTKEVA